MTRAIFIAILTATLAAFGGLAAACDGGGGDALTLEEYFARFEEIDQNVDQEIEALFADFPESEEEFFSNEENLPLVQDLFAGFPRVLGDALDELRGVEPPSEVEEAHEAFLGAGDELLAGFESAADQVADVDSISEVEAINASVEPEIMPLEAQFDAACLDLVAIGTENGITVAVSCEDE